MKACRGGKHARAVERGPTPLPSASSAAAAVPGQAEARRLCPRPSPCCWKGCRRCRPRCASPPRTGSRQGSRQGSRGKAASQERSAATHASLGAAAQPVAPHAPDHLEHVCHHLLPLLAALLLVPKRGVDGVGVWGQQVVHSAHVAAGPRLQCSRCGQMSAGAAGTAGPMQPRILHTLDTPRPGPAQPCPARFTPARAWLKASAAKCMRCTCSWVRLSCGPTRLLAWKSLPGSGAGTERE